MDMLMRVRRFDIFKRWSMIAFFFMLFIVILNGVSATPYLYRHHIVMIQGDDPATEEVEPEDELVAIERYFFLIPWNETWVEVPVPKIARLEGMTVDEVFYSDSMGFLPGEYSAYWNQEDPPYTLFKDMTDMECCVADFYAWGFPLNAERNHTLYSQIPTETNFSTSIDEGRSTDAWNITDHNLSLLPGNELGMFISEKTRMGVNITEIQLYWDASAREDNITFFVSDNNGTDWVDFTHRKGETVDFPGNTSDLVWKINMTQNITLNNTPVLEDLWVNVTFVPEYTDITLQLDYVIERKSGRFEYTWDFYKNWEDGVAPHILIYTDKDHDLKSQNIDLTLYGSQEEFPDKDVYIFMQGNFQPEASVTITKAEDEFPWALILIPLIMALIIVAFVLARPKRRGQEVPPGLGETEEAQFGEDEEGELEELRNKKEGLLKAIKKLDGDFEEGLIDEDVYNELKGSYKGKTVDVMKEIDALSAMAVAASLKPEVNPEEGALKEKKEKILKSIKKLESDYKEGLIDEETYNELRDDYKKKAVEVAKELESFKEK
jgi:hypothetical protein